MPTPFPASLPIAGIQRTSTLDFPGQLACVLFLPGCSMRCFYCHNAAFAYEGKAAPLPAAAAEDFLRRRRGLLDGVVVSGGEPTLQPELPALLRFLKEQGFHVKLDSNGLQPERIAPLLEAGLIDYAAIDWKAPRSELPDVCGVPESAFDTVRDTISLLQGSGVSLEARTTLYPGLTAEGLLQLAGALPPLPCYRLNFYRVPDRLSPERIRPEERERAGRPALTPAAIDALAPRLRALQPGLVY